MPTAIDIVFAPEDEAQLFEFLERFHLTVYPDRIPPGYSPFLVRRDTAARLVEPSYYLAAEEVGPIQVRTVKKGRDRGATRIDETSSPVIHYDRSIKDELGQLRSGQLWTELNITGDVQRNSAFPDTYRRVWLQMREHLISRCHRSNPPGYLVGIQAARLARAGLVLREAGRKGDLLEVHK
jgi:hypothetical protein